MVYNTFQPNPEDFDECTLATCPQDAAIIKYLPSLAGNATYLAIFAILLLIHTVLGIRYRTWGFLVGTSYCFTLEIIGYSGRIILHSNPFPLSNFLMYFTTIALAPAFLNGSIYLVLGRYIIATSTAASRLKPRTYTITFISADLTSLVLQAIGGALTSVAEDNAGRTQGTHILIAGLVM